VEKINISWRVAKL
jgi:hypothetical protein